MAALATLLVRKRPLFRFCRFLAVLALTAAVSPLSSATARRAPICAPHFRTKEQAQAWEDGLEEVWS